MRYWVAIEKGKGNYSAYAPDVPGCVATGKTIPEVKDNFQQALRFHIEGLKEDRLHIPKPKYRLPIIIMAKTRGEEYRKKLEIFKRYEF